MQLKTYTTLILALVISSLSLTAQSFYYEGFAGGALPAGWTSVDLTSVAGEECLFAFEIDANTGYGEADFMASSTADGYMKANSDEGLTADRAVNHTTQLTTAAIDCSAQSTIWLSFETQAGAYLETLDVNAIARVSTDGTNWTDFTIFPTVTEPNQWTDGTVAVSLDISAVAANQATVFVQWQWIGVWEYIWSIDDINLSSANLFPAQPNDMRINSYAAISPNAVTPASQVEPFGFIADIENVGSAEQVDITLDMTILDAGGTEVFNDFVTYDMVGPDSLAENVFFTNEFTPPAVPENYVATYSLEYDSPDPEDDPSNNELSFDFAVSDTTFAKETGATIVTRPGGDDLNFTYGNVFYVGSNLDLEGNQLFARYITFRVRSTTPGPMTGTSVNVFLYKWNGDLDPDGRSITEDLYEFEGLSEYTFTGSEGGDLINVEVNPGDPVALEANTYYIPAIQVTTGNEIDFYIGASEDRDYFAAYAYSDSMAVLNNNPKLTRYGSVLDVGNEGTLDIVGFGFDIVPVVRLSIGEAIIVATEEVQLAAGSVSIFPNPAKEYATVDLTLEEVTSGTVQVLDIQGKVIQTHVLNNVQQHRLNLITKDLPSGQYTLRVQTELGVSTQKLVVQH